MSLSGRASPRIKAALISAMVYPGAGQVWAGARTRGVVVVFVASVALVALLRRIVQEALVSLPEDPTQLAIGDVFRLAQEIEAGALASLYGWTALLVIVWLLGIWDAYRRAPEG